MSLGDDRTLNAQNGKMAHQETHVNQALNHHRTTLATLAGLAMFSRGLEPEFSTAVQEQLAGLKAQATGQGGDVRDLRSRDWFSIDNDDSRDLDQLSLSEAVPKGG